MGVCGTFIDSAIGRITTIANTSSYPTGDDLYEGKHVWVLDINELQVYTGTEWRTVYDIDGWTTWTPTLGGTGYAIGANGVISGIYKKFPDKSYEWAIAILWGAASTSGAGPMTVTTPATLINTAMSTTGVGISQVLANASSFGLMTDTSAGIDYQLALKYNSTTVATVQALAYNGAAAGAAYVTRANCTSTIPIAPATGDTFFLCGRGFS